MFVKSMKCMLQRVLLDISVLEVSVSNWISAFLLNLFMSQLLSSFRSELLHSNSILHIFFFDRFDESVEFSPFEDKSPVASNKLGSSGKYRLITLVFANLCITDWSTLLKVLY